MDPSQESQHRHRAGRLDRARALVLALPRRVWLGATAAVVAVVLVSVGAVLVLGQGTPTPTPAAALDVVPTDETAAQTETFIEPPAADTSDRAEKKRAKREVAAGDRARAKLARAVEATAKKKAKKDAEPQLVTTDGPLGQVQIESLGAGEKPPAEIQVDVAVANIPNRTADAGWRSSMGTLTAGLPDFITLNEVSQRSTESIESLLPSYQAHRSEVFDGSLGAAGQSRNNVVLYRSDRWTLLAGGMVRVVDDDRGYLHKRPFVFDRFAVWAVLRATDGSTVSVISTHMPTNPRKYPAQPGSQAISRAERYGRGMDTIIAMSDQLSTYGPVLIGGDMNSHPGDGPWAAADKLTAAGFGYAKDSGVMYLFHEGTDPLLASRQVGIVSDHPALLATVSLQR